MSDLAQLIMVRPARASDLPAIEALHKASVRELAAGYYAPAVLERFLAAGTVDRGLIDAGTYYLAEILGCPAGSAGWMAVDDYPGGAWRARIRSVFVHPHWARKGIGKRLVQHAETEAARAGFRYFELDALLPGVPLYHHLGYREVERRGYALPDGTTLPVIRMERMLAPTAGFNEWGTRGLVDTSAARGPVSP